jgi:transmembrane sensor
MDELAKELSVLRDDLEPAWSEERSEHLFAGVAKLRHKRKVQRIAASACAAVLGVGVVLAGVRMQASERAEAFAGSLAHSQRQHVTDDVTPRAATAASPVQVAESRLSAGHKLRLSDGSLAQLLSTEGELDVLSNRRERVELRLLSGHAHFDVVPNKARHFTVGAGPVQVIVVGTVFDVTREGGRVHVTVFEGRVRVQSAAGAVFVSENETQSFDEAGRVIDADADADDGAASMSPVVITMDGTADEQLPLDAEHARKGSHAGARSHAQKSQWRSLTQAGDYDAAYREIVAGGPVDDEPAALMDAADAARLSNHPEAAVQYLERVVKHHRGSPVSPLAAFTLGRVRLERLGQPSEAAAAFASARSLAPLGSLAQDALAREVEALSKAGNTREANERAQQYVRAYPSGRRLHAVRLYGGLESR